MAKKNKHTFENKIEELEKIVQFLEEGTPSLEESIKAFENGIKLSNECHKELSNAESKIDILTKNGDKIKKKETFKED
ncbi:MAG: exodeoxyribonuclease VII small subunit [Deltaproteobacteria bacterium]|nr:exodeoxyribonuclease VII small subunit [Deltaproteobacteria bacterium]